MTVRARETSSAPASQDEVSSPFEPAPKASGDGVSSSSLGGTGSESGRPKESLVRVWLEDVGRAIRSLLSTPRYALPALLSLALGIAASTAVFAVFSAIVLRPLPFPDDDQLVVVRLAGVSEESDRTGGASLSFTYLSELKERKDVFRALAGYRLAGVTVARLSEVRHATAAQVTPDFFDTLRPAAELGRTFTSVGGAPEPSSVVVLGHSYWTSAFGGAPVIGTSVLIEGRPKTVVGVIADDLAMPARADLWIPVEPTEDERSERFLLGLTAIGRIAEVVSPEAAHSMLRAWATAQNVRSPDGKIVYSTTIPLRDWLVGDRRTSAVLMFVAVGAFLLLACANVAALLVTRASLRSPERAIRAALGA